MLCVPRFPEVCLCRTLLRALENEMGIHFFTMLLLLTYGLCRLGGGGCAEAITCISEALETAAGAPVRGWHSRAWPRPARNETLGVRGTSYKKRNHGLIPLGINPWFLFNPGDDLFSRGLTPKYRRPWWA